MRRTCLRSSLGARPVVGLAGGAGALVEGGAAQGNPTAQATLCDGPSVGVGRLVGLRQVRERADAVGIDPPLGEVRAIGRHVSGRVPHGDKGTLPRQPVGHRGRHRLERPAKRGVAVGGHPQPDAHDRQGRSDRCGYEEMAASRGRNGGDRDRRLSRHAPILRGHACGPTAVPVGAAEPAARPQFGRRLGSDLVRGPDRGVSSARRIAGRVVVELSEQLLEVGAHVVTAILATWLGLLVLTRATSARGTRVFVFLCGLLVLWSVSIAVQRTTDDASLTASVNLFEDVAAWLLPAATVHIAFVIAFEGRYTRAAAAVLVLAYGLGVTGIVQAVVDPTHPIAFDEPNWEPFGIDGTTVAWVFTGLRAFVFGAAIGYLVAGLRAAGDDRARRRQLIVAIATVGVGVIGGMLRILPPELGGPRFVGVTLVAVAVVLATYAVVAQHVFLASDVAARAVRWSLVAGIGVVAYVVAILALDAAVGAALAIDLPIVTALAIVGTLALFEPVSAWVRGRVGTDSGSADEQRLLVALGADPLLTQAPERALMPALERVARTYDLSGASIMAADGQVLASVGDVDPDGPDGLRLGLEDGGRAVFIPGPGRSFTRSELGALRLASGYLASSLRLAERQEQQVAAIGELRAEREAVESRGSALQDALARATDPDDALHVFALGPLRAERDGEPVRRWGGEKAGSRQAEAIFALLFDRGERGASKDEILEVVWPDVELERADVAFHRTMLGLRATLRPGRRGGGSSANEPIGFHNDRYRLDASTVAWSDLAEFERLLALAQGAGDDALDALEQARALYRGEYLDDVPYLGDSAAIEERREQLRDALGDVLTELAARYGERGDRVAAAACERQAAAVAEGAYAPPLTSG